MSLALVFGLVLEFLMVALVMGVEVLLCLESDWSVWPLVLGVARLSKILLGLMVLLVVFQEVLLLVQGYFLPCIWSLQEGGFVEGKGVLAFLVVSWLWDDLDIRSVAIIPLLVFVMTKVGHCF